MRHPLPHSLTYPITFNTIILSPREKELLSSIMSGNALEHHLEPSYYAALDQALKNSKESDTA